MGSHDPARRREEAEREQRRQPPAEGARQRPAPPAERGQPPWVGQVWDLHAGAGNAAVARLLRDATLQRQPPGQTPAPAGPVTAPPAKPPKPDFGNRRFLDFGERFDLFYEPNGPVPAIGKVTVTLRVHVTFRDFTRAMMRRPEFRGARHRWTREQLRDFAFPPEEQRDWFARFARAVRKGWREKHTFALRDPGFAPHRARCEVEVLRADKPADAHTVLVAQWVPRGAPRLRSTVVGGLDEQKAALLDWRDPDTPVTGRGQRHQLIRQIGGFDHDSDVVNAEVQRGIDEFVKRFRQLRKPGGPFAVPMDKIDLGFAGRATAPGGRAYNERLALRRAGAVADRVADALGTWNWIAMSKGEQHASADPKFRRVDATATVSEGVEVSQNVAVHEAGHMFGLGDEYEEEEPDRPGVPEKFEGDEPAGPDPDQERKVRDLVGDDAAEEMRVHDNPSIMSVGSEVLRGHYVYFLQSLNAVTGKDWVIE